MAVACPHAAPASPTLELADIFREHGPSYAQTHPLGSTQHKVMRAIVNCRTAALGGHLDWCGQCGYQRYVYHSCRNRHCPKCQTLAKAQWLEDRQQELLPVPYFHNVFTLPHELNPLILYSDRNRRALLNLLFSAAAQTLLAFGQNNLGGKLGFTLVLHTWDQQLRPHFHVHCLIAAGALAEDGSKWIEVNPKFLFPVRALSKVFRGKYLQGQRELLDQQQLDLPPQLAGLGDQHRWQRTLRRKGWVVYSKPPFAGPQKLLDYLGRYTHRVAISNHRLVAYEDGQVRFRYRDRRRPIGMGAPDRQKTMSLPGDEFIGRFLRHVLPKGLMRLRHYGFLANRIKQQALLQCRQALDAQPPEAAPAKTPADWMLLLTGQDITRCPRCGHAPLASADIPPVRTESPATRPTTRTDDFW